MRRSWLALAIVVVVIIVVVTTQIKQPSERVVEEPEEGKAKLASIEAPSPDATVEGPAAHVEEPPDTDRDKQTPAPPPEPIPVPATAEAVLEKANALRAADKLAEAQRLLSDAVTRQPPLPNVDSIKKALTAFHDEVLFSPKPSPLGITYTIQDGDFLGKIARKHKTTIELIKRLNALPSDTIYAGRSLKIIPGGFDVEVVKSQFKLTVSKDGLWIREFKVGLGKDGSTPVGEFAAGDRIEKPPYTAVHPPIPYEDRQNNPLGTHWITISGAYGIHGTWEPDSIGKEASKGCIRMRNEDVQWLFALIVKGQSKIVVKQ